MCLASCGLPEPAKDPAAAPLCAQEHPSELVVDDDLIDVANELLDEAPFELRQVIRRTLRLTGDQPLRLNYLSVAHFAGIRAETEQIVRLLISLSTVPIRINRPVPQTTAA